MIEHGVIDRLAEDAVVHGFAVAVDVDVAALGAGARGRERDRVRVARSEGRVNGVGGPSEIAGGGEDVMEVVGSVGESDRRAIGDRGVKAHASAGNDLRRDRIDADGHLCGELVVGDDGQMIEDAGDVIAQRCCQRGIPTLVDGVIARPPSLRSVVAVGVVRMRDVSEAVPIVDSVGAELEIEAVVNSAGDSLAEAGPQRVVGGGVVGALSVEVLVRLIDVPRTDLVDRIDRLPVAGGGKRAPRGLGDRAGVVGIEVEVAEVDDVLPHAQRIGIGADGGGFGISAGGGARIVTVQARLVVRVVDVDVAAGIVVADRAEVVADRLAGLTGTACGGADAAHALKDQRVGVVDQTLRARAGGRAVERDHLVIDRRVLRVQDVVVAVDRGGVAVDFLQRQHVDGLGDAAGDAVGGIDIDAGREVREDGSHPRRARGGLGAKVPGVSAVHGDDAQLRPRRRRDRARSRQRGGADY
jgi:hypothetical protein